MIVSHDTPSLPTESLQPVTTEKILRVGYTPDSDDVMNFYAWESGRIALPGWRARFHKDCISALNRGAEMQQFDLVSISSVRYPFVAQNYWILSSGSSVGRGYGPVLVAKEAVSIDQLRGRRVAVGGRNTTGCALLQMYCPGTDLVEMRYDQIADAIIGGQIDAGVMIHEELLYFVEKGLSRVCDLGALWCQRTGLPLPVGLNVVHKRVGRQTAAGIAAVCRQSLQWGLEHRDEAIAFAARFGRGCTPRFVDMFSNADTLRMPEDVEQALAIVFKQVSDLGLAPALESYEVIRDQCE